MGRKRANEEVIFKGEGTLLKETKIYISSEKVSGKRVPALVRWSDISEMRGNSSRREEKRIPKASPRSRSEMQVLHSRPVIPG